MAQSFSLDAADVVDADGNGIPDELRHEHGTLALRIILDDGIPLTWRGLGSLTGLIPGFHVNNVALILLSFHPPC